MVTTVMFVADTEPLGEVPVKILGGAGDPETRREITPQELAIRDLNSDLPLPIYCSLADTFDQHRRPSPNPPGAASTPEPVAPPRRAHAPPDTLLRRRSRV